MLNFAICEDESGAAEQLEGLIARYCREKGLEGAVKTFDTGEALLTARPQPDIVLMDIRLPGEDGMAAARRLRQAGFGGGLIFITAYPQYVFGAFDLEAVHYLLKPARRETLFPALDRAAERVSASREQTILLRRQGQPARTAVGRIYYCEALGRQIIVHTREERLEYAGSLDSLEARLGPPFFRCHRSYLVNMEAVTGRQGEWALFPGGGKALISRRKRREFGQKLLDCCRKG